LTEKFSHALPRFFELLALRILHIPNRAFEYANFLINGSAVFYKELNAICKPDPGSHWFPSGAAQSQQGWSQARG
jgi:hypothetical protein